jgi:hypothetical protein
VALNADLGQVKVFFFRTNNVLKPLAPISLLPREDPSVITETSFFPKCPFEP